METKDWRPITHASAWKRDELIEGEWLVALSDSDANEIDQALRTSQRSGKRWGHFGIEHFPLPTFRQKMSGISRTLVTGYGFCLLRGLPIDRYSLDDLKAIHWGLSSHLGTMAFQGGDGERLHHVEDARRFRLDDPNRRTNLTNEILFPHADPSDVVALLCVRKAAQGGESTLASSGAIYNELLKRRPDYLALLTRPFYETTNLRFDDTSGDPFKTISETAVPVFSMYEDRLACVFRRRRMVQGMERHGTPLTNAELEAMYFVESLANSDELRFDMELQPGDIQFLNNYTILHARKAFVDRAEPGEGRLMLRTWINLHASMPIDPHVATHVRRGWPLPPEKLTQLTQRTAS